MPTNYIHRGCLDYPTKEFGRSILGAPLEVIIPQGKEVDILLVAGQHGDEPEGTCLLSSALRSFDMDALEVAVVLALNPDGLARGTRCNARGVDLNRNFPSTNWSSEPVFYRWSEDSLRDVQLSPGESASSEPETQAFISLIEDLKPSTVVTLHAPLECVDDPDGTNIGKWLSRRSGLPLVENIGYPTPGSFGSWGAEQHLSVITFELPHESLESHRSRYLELFIEFMSSSVHE